MPTPAPVEEGRLEDDVRAVVHRGERGGLGGPQRLGCRQPDLGDLDDPLAVRTQPLEVGLFMGIAPVLHQLDGRVRATMRPLPQAVHPAELQRRQVVAGQESDQIGGTDDDGPVGESLHRQTLAAVRVRLRVRALG